MEHNYTIMTTNTTYPPSNWDIPSNVSLLSSLSTAAELVTNFTNTTAQQDEETQMTTGSQVNWILVGCMAGMLVVLSTIFLWLVIPPLVSWIKDFWPVAPHRIERRYETIEGWLISKRVKNCNGCCTDIMCKPCEVNETVNEQIVTLVEHDKKNKTQVSVMSPLKSIPSIDTAETMTSVDDIECCNIHDKNECSICMETFTKDTIVSWSPNSKCDHVFHHSCIKEWLLHHDTCPCCRTQFLLVDADPNDYGTITNSHPSIEQMQDDSSSNERNNSSNRQQDTTNGNNETNGNTKIKSSSRKLWTMEQLKVLAKQRSIRYNSTFYCMEHGLVLIDPKDKSRRLDKATRKKLITSNISSTEELIQLRRSCNGAKSQANVDGEVPSNEVVLTSIATCLDNPSFTSRGQNNVNISEPQMSSACEVETSCGSSDMETGPISDCNHVQVLEYNDSIQGFSSTHPSNLSANENDQEIVWSDVNNSTSRR